MNDKAKTAEEAGEIRTKPEADTETVTIPLDPAGTSDSVYLCVDGRSMLVRHGVPVRIPAAFAEVWRSSQAQELAARQTQQAAVFPG